MKKYLILLLVFVCVDMYGQVKPVNTPLMIQAGIYMNKNSVKYDPSKAFEIYKQCADQGNARAMNSLAILYSEGTGTMVNKQEALKWFELSAEKKYSEAYHNLGNMYRTGWGVEQDFKIAYQWFKNGGALNSITCMYDQGYMLFKGLGVTQNYQQAITLFRKGIKGGSSGSMYMLGLCFRNGYGIVKNIDSARYWLGVAAARGYRFAKEELQVPEPENISNQLLGSADNTGNDQYKVASAPLGKSKIYSTFQRVTHNAKPADVSGEYSGFVIRYDYSGQHVIGKSVLKLKLDTGGNTISGTWKEGESPIINLQAEITDSGLVFNNSAYFTTDHYSAGQPVNYLFKNARLLVVKQKDSVYMAGNLQLWSATRNEPEKPVYISLVRNTPVARPELNSTELLKVKASSASELKVYPNPFKSSLQVSFSLNQKSRVEISIADLTGRIVYGETPRSLTIGKYNFTIQPNLQLGAYLLTLNCNGQVSSTVIVKQ